ncbi:unnamed protein product [Parnassius apollo]|uniref:(apollo) hypothetical protein n=1 Tax=Parnassius apollo TaxID=110799 RepID=A0A8S3WFQ6_PARAO|nr:unnamed protein product [Parnassius apollo]
MIISHLTEYNNEEPKRKEISEEENVISLSKRDLVILYENADNTKQTDLKNRPDRRTPNQHVETVIYNGDLESEDSDIGEIYCNQDLYDVVLINKERLDILNSVPSLDKTLCQKFGDYNIDTDLSVDYNEEFLYKNNFVQEQLNSLRNVSNLDTFGATFLSTSLLDYIFSNRFDDNSNFYMDNVIQFVNRTIDQLKRISNGDYLTDKAREKWKRLESERKSDQVNKNAKVVMKTKSNPLHVEGNITSLKNTWRDIVYSELDIRALSKILRNKIVVEIPRLIHGSYKLFSKYSDGNLIICCKKTFQKPKSKVDKKSWHDIVVQLKLPNSHNVRTDIDSVTILQKVLPRNETWYPLKYNYLESTKSIDNTLQNKVTTIELNEHEVEQSICSLENDISSPMPKLHIEHQYEETTKTENSVLCTSKISSQVTDQISNCCNNIIKHTDNEEKESDTQSPISDMISSSVDDLFCSIQKFNTHTTLLEENEDFPSIRKKSPTKVRIKSPYENKSFFIEERKRKKLLEIRERRERRKKAHSENCKGKKYKYGKGAVMAQPSNSVTKLSITNKSFYNSIYGESANINKKYIKNHSQKGSSEILSESSVEKPIMKFATLKVDEDFLNGGEKDNIIKDYYISPTCAKNNDFSMDFNSFTFHDVPCATNLRPTNILISKEKHNESPMSVRMHNTAPASIINSNDSDKSFTKKSLISLECKKSIDKIYELMKKLSKVDSSDSSSSKCDFSLTNESNMHPLKGKSLTLQISDSGTSLKHQLTSSNPSIYSFKETNNTAEFPKIKNVTINTTRAEANVIPKVVISSKSHIRKLDKNEIKSVKKVTINIPENSPKNPLKAISHLINEFDHIQKNNQGTITEAIENKKSMNGAIDSKSLTRHKKVSHYENQTKVDSNKIVIPNDRKTQSKLLVNRGKIINQQISIDDRNVEKRNKITDIVDEALREARGEAVRGPSKPYTRLDSLSQPKRLNINTQNGGIIFRHGKNTIPDKLSHLKFAAPQIPEKPTVSTSTYNKFRPKRNEQENVTTLNSKSPRNLTTTEKPTRQKRTINNFPIDNKIPPINTTSYKQRNVPENSRQFKKAIPTESLNLKKHNRQLSLTQTAASSNLLQKPYKSQTTPAPNFSQQSREATCIGFH